MQEIALDRSDIILETDTKMLNTAQSTTTFSSGLECKQCRHAVSHEETVAYHLVDQILYGWCQSCFGHRHTATDVLRGELAS